MMQSRYWRALPTIFGLLAVLGVMAPSTAAAAKGSRVGAQVSFGVDMAKRGLWSEALFRFQKADRLKPNDPKTLNNLAVAYEAVGNFEQAMEYYQRALRASPSNRDLKKNYSRFVEFYQGFKPDGEESEEEPAGETASDDMRREG